MTPWSLQLSADVCMITTQNEPDLLLILTLRTAATVKGEVGGSISVALLATMMSLLTMTLMSCLAQ